MSRTAFGAAKILLVLAAALPLAAFTDKAKKFSVTFPQGWSDPTTDDRGNVQSNAPGVENVWCRANSNELPTLKGLTQASLNKAYGAPLDQATWAGVLSVDASKIKLIANGARIVNGVITQFATISFAQDVMGVEVKGRFVSYVMPGRMVNVACFAATAAYPGMNNAFEKIVTSLKPL